MSDEKTGKSWREQHIVLRLTAVYIFTGLIAAIIAMFTKTSIPTEFTAIFLGCLTLWEVLNSVRYNIKKKNGK